MMTIETAFPVTPEELQGFQAMARYCNSQEPVSQSRRTGKPKSFFAILPLKDWLGFVALCLVFIALVGIEA